MIRHNKRRAKNEPTNTRCDSCERPIWARKGIYTMRKVKPHYSVANELESYSMVVDNLRAICVCPQCYQLGVKIGENEYS